MDKNWEEKALSKYERVWNPRVGKFFSKVDGLAKGLPSKIAIAEWMDESYCGVWERSIKKKKKEMVRAHIKISKRK